MTLEIDYLASLLGHGRVEIRTRMRDGRWASGIFDSLDQLLAAGADCERQGLDTYTTINPTHLPVTNDVRPYRGGVGDNDVTEIRRILFDLDPVRETGQGATDFQVKEARLRADRLASLLSNRGWPDPMIAFSGNGWHLQYQVCMPRAPEVRLMLDWLYRGLGLRMDTAEVHFDRSVRNPSRICRMYGTTNHKSNRASYVEFIPGDSLVDPMLVASTAKEFQPPKPKAAPRPKVPWQAEWNRIDVVGLFKSLGLYKRHVGGEKHAVTCPYVEKHSTPDDPMSTDTVIWDRTTYPKFCCLHDHCREIKINDILRDFAS